MKKTISVFVLTSCAVLSAAFAPVSYASGCVSLGADLSYGARGQNVRALQEFLVGRGYPGSGSWMVTGYFGRATQAAVQNFQTEARLSATGIVDAQTRDAVARVSCGTSSNTPAYYYGASTYNPFSYNNYGTQYPYASGAATLSALSAYSAQPGATVTLYGTGFASTNTVYIGNVTVLGYSNDGTTMSIVVPQMTGGTFNLSVLSGSSSSNALQFTVLSNGCSYGTCGCTGNAASCLASPQIYSLSPVSGKPGTSVTVYGSGFSSTGNTVRFGNGIIANLLSSDGQSVSFTVPASLSGYGVQTLSLGAYPVSVSNNLGRTTNVLSFTVTSLDTSVAPVITAVSGPSTLNYGSLGTWTLTVDNRGNTYSTVNATWGDPVYGAYMSAPVQIAGSGVQTVQLTHAYTQSGAYTITFTLGTPSGNATTYTATVQVGGTASGVSISSLTPSTGRAGTQVLVQGNGFTADNTVHFGIGGVLHLAAINGTTLYFTIPTTLSACDLVTTGCSSGTALLSTGSYPLFITNTSGTSNTATFTVQ